jgi:hypothetical protein
MPDTDRRRLYLQIFLIAFAALLLEIAYTRIVAFKFYYYFTYLVIGFALLGLGAGGVLVTVSRRLRDVPLDKLVPACGVIGAVAVAASYQVIASLELEIFQIFETALGPLRFAALCAALFATFGVVGIALARILGSMPEAVNRLYAADLAGAALACGLAVPLMSLFSPPATVFLGGAALALAAVVQSAAPRWRIAGAGVAVVLVGLALAPGAIPGPVPDPIKDLSPAKMEGSRSVLRFSQWSPVFRVDVVERPRLKHLLLIAHDGTLGSTLQRFDGDFSKLGRFDRDPRTYPFQVGKKQPRVLVIGSAGGHEILASLYFGAEHVTGVELNPVTLSLVRDHFADYTGRLAERDRVTLVNAEGRSFLAADDAKYDLIYFVAPDSYTTMNAAASGAFVLSESYLYTTQMLRETFAHLEDDGIVCMQFGEFFYERKPNRTARYAATARQALAELGIRDFEKHILVATSPDFIDVSTILLKKTPFSEAEVQRFMTTTRRIEGARARHAWGRKLDDGPVNRVISLPDDRLGPWLEEHPYDVSPVTDDSPFFWHFVRFRDAIARRTDTQGGLIDHEDSVGERVLLTMLGFSAVFAVVLLLLPFVAIRDTWRELPGKGRTVLYFGCLGLGFLFFEIVLIQKLTLFLGYPTYSLIVTLLSLLLFSAGGSLMAERLTARRDRNVWLLVGALAAIAAGQVFALPQIVDLLVGAPLPVRVVVSILFIAPLGLCLGTFMPLGLSAVAALTQRADVYIAWAWAVNGFFSVLSSVLTTMLSMAWGFDLVLALAVGIYVLAALALRGLPGGAEAA